MKRIFGVPVTFLAAGDVFRTGLQHASEAIDAEYESCLCDDPSLESKIRAFAPDLIIVIHGRTYAKKWGQRFKDYKQALWLTDDPYEVDDCEEYSRHFDYVFTNDKSTVHRHRNCTYLPTCYDPIIHNDPGRERIYRCGFVGGHNRVRNDLLQTLDDAKLIDYLVGGPWRSMLHLYKAPNVPPSQTADWYQQTKVVPNIWREEHHANFKERIQGYSMNPRVYEALACGAMVISEYRPEVEEIFPDMPTFRVTDSRGDARKAELDAMCVQVDRLIHDDALRLDLLAKCQARLTGHTYTDRLKTIIDVCFA